jgi:ABC-type Fe3+/spermidine/putrescine transport system ATPase subunit
VGDHVVVSLRPEKIRIVENKSLSHNCYQGSVKDITYIGSDTRLVVDLGEVTLNIWEQNKISTLDPEAYFEQREQVWVVVLPENALVLREE